MKRFLIIILSFIMMFSTVTFADSNKEEINTQQPKKNTVIKDFFRKFEEAHPKFRPAYNKLMNMMKNNHRDIYEKAFTNINEFEKNAEDQNSNLLNEELKAKLAVLNAKRDKLLHKDFLTYEDKIFEIFSDLDLNEDFEETDSKREENMQELLNEYKQIATEYPELNEFLEKTSTESYNIIEKEIDKANEEFYNNMQQEIKEFIKNSEISKEEKEELSNVLEEIIEQINSNFTEYFDIDSLDNVEPEENKEDEMEAIFAEMVDTLHAYDKKHPEYKDAWYEIIDLIQDSHVTAFKEAFEEFAKKDSERENSAKEEGKFDKETLEKLDNVITKTRDLMNLNIRIQAVKLFGIFNMLAEDGYFDYFEDNEFFNIDSESVAEQIQELNKEWELLKQDDLNITAHLEEYFKNVNEDIFNYLSIAHHKARTLCEEGVIEIYKKYNIPDEDQEEIKELFYKMARQINDSFIEYMESMDLVEPLTFNIN